MSNPTWKKVERRIAKEIGGQRIGILGGEDVRHDKFSFEVKFRKELPMFLKNAYQQACDNCPDGKIPILVLKEKYKKYEDCLIILNLKDFLRI